MVLMEPRMTPIVITDLLGLGRVLNMIRTLAGLSQAEAAARYGVTRGLISLRERGKRQTGVIDLSKVLQSHNYVLVVMHVDDMADIPRVRVGEPADG
jgi:predicted transcriptional regulator